MTKRTISMVLAFLVAIGVGPALGQSVAETMPAPMAMDDKRELHFGTSCRPTIAKKFDHAMVFLYAFWAKDAIADFKTVLQQDPDCVMAYWGIAMALQQNPLTGQQPSAEMSHEALVGLDTAMRIGAKTQRETDYLAAVDLIYRNADKFDFPTRRRAYERAMEALAQRYPDDSEAQIFYALSLDMTASLTDKTYANQLKAAGILERILVQQPNHPGVAHYLIHSYDYPPIAEHGVAAARLYAHLAPNHPHALHMPSHIFTRLGMWQDSINSNVRSAAAAKAEGNGQEQAHAMDYLVYAYLQRGEDAEAQRVVAESVSLAVNPAVFIGPYALAAMPARYAVERGAWDEAVTLPVRTTKFSFPEAITHYARGLGFVHLNNLPLAAEESTRLAELRDALAARKDTYWSNQVEVQRLGLDAWIAFARGNRDEAFKSMRAAADLEDSMEKHIVTPGAIVPARELLGDMLREAGRFAEALVAYGASAKREPLRLQGLYGAAKAAAATGDRKRAHACYEKLASLAVGTSTTRPEFVEAKAYLAQ